MSDDAPAKKPFNWDKFQQNLGYTDEQMAEFKADARRRRAAEVLPEANRKTIVATVVASHGCAAGFKEGDTIEVSAAGLVKSCNVCIYAVAPMTIHAAMAHDRIAVGTRSQRHVVQPLQLPGRGLLQRQLGPGVVQGRSEVIRSPIDAEPRLRRDLRRLRERLRLRADPLGIKLFETVEAMEAIPGLRRPQQGVRFSMCQVVGQARWLGWTIGVDARERRRRQQLRRRHGAQRAVEQVSRRQHVPQRVVRDRRGVAASTRRRCRACRAGKYAARGDRAARQGPPRSARHGADLRHARPDDPDRQCAPASQLRALRLHRDRRDGMRRFVGTRTRDAAAEHFHSLLRGAALRRRAGRRARHRAAAWTQLERWRAASAGSPSAASAIRSRRTACRTIRRRRSR